MMGRNRNATSTSGVYVFGLARSLESESKWTLSTKIVQQDSFDSKLTETRNLNFTTYKVG